MPERLRHLFTKEYKTIDARTVKGLFVLLTLQTLLILTLLFPENLNPKP